MPKKQLTNKINDKRTNKNRKIVLIVDFTNEIFSSRKVKLVNKHSSSRNARTLNARAPCNNNSFLFNVHDSKEYEDNYASEFQIDQYGSNFGGNMTLSSNI